MAFSKTTLFDQIPQHQKYWAIWSIAVACATVLTIRVQSILGQGAQVTAIEHRPDRKWLHFDDKSDYQWFHFREQLLATAIIISVHICLTHIVDRAVKYRKSGRAIFQLVAGLVCTFYLHGLDWFCAIALVLLYYGISKLDKYSASRPYTLTVAWTTTISILVLTSAFADKSTWLLPFMSKNTSPRYPFNRSMNLLLLRLVSFVSDHHWSLCPLSVVKTRSPSLSQARLRMGQLIVSRSRQASEYSLLNLAAYAFFIPLYVAGPIITFNSFAHNLNVVSRPRSSWVGRKFGMLIAYLVIVEFLFTRATLPSAWLGVPENQQWYRLFNIRELIMLGGCLLVYTWIKFKFLWALFRFWSMTCGFYCQENLPDFVFETYRQVHSLETQ